MKCGYCGKDFIEADYHYCQEGQRFLLDELARLRAALAAKDAEIERLRAEVETLAWNLGGISTLACSRKLAEFDSSMARPALHDVAALVKDYSALASAAPEQKPETCVWKAVSNPLNEEEWYETECKNTSTDIGKFCLHCGKRVEVEE